MAKRLSMAILFLLSGGMMNFRWIFPLPFITSFILMISSLSEGENHAPFLLRIHKAETMEVLINLPIRERDQFYLYYFHSSDKTPIWDTFMIEGNGQLVLIEEAYAWYGAGLEFQNHKNIQLIQEGSWTKVRLNRPFQFLPIRIGRVAQQVFIFQDQSIPLSDLAKPGETLLLSIIQRGEK